MRKYCVYFHINKINHKVYVGITGTTPEARWGKNGYRYHNQNHFWAAIQKYGWDNFIHVVRHTGLVKEEAEYYEKFYISYFASNDKRYGYNKALGGMVNDCGKDCFSKENINRRAREYYYRHKDELNKKTKQWRDAHKEERKQYNHEYYINNKSKNKGKMKEYRELHKDELKEYSKSYYKTHKEQFLKYNKDARERNKLK